MQLFSEARWCGRIDQVDQTQAGHFEREAESTKELWFFHQTPSHMIHNCNAVKASKTHETASNKGRDTGKHNDWHCQGCKNKANLAAATMTTPPFKLTWT